MATYRQMVLLGLLLERPMYGQQIREVIEQHHRLFAEAIKKPTIYYQLERLVQDGDLEVRQESVEAPGTGLAHEALALRERAVYHITERGRTHFLTLLRQALGGADAPLGDLDAGLFFLDRLAPAEAAALLRERYVRVARERAGLTEALGSGYIEDRAHRLVADRQLALLDAELNWLARTLIVLQPDAGQGASTPDATARQTPPERPAHP
jgi:DNA-binding PadR family transcriptional regulator